VQQAQTEAASAATAAKDAAQGHAEVAAAVQQLQTQLPQASEAARQATTAAAAVAELQQHLAQLSGAVASSSGSAAAAAAEQAVQQQKQLDDLSQMLFELRVEMQNGVCDATRRLEDLEILEASRKAAATRAEEAAADALEKVRAWGVRHQCGVCGLVCSMLDDACRFRKPPGRLLLHALKRRQQMLWRRWAMMIC
jgi:chromosome segregation ATPase